MSVQIRNPELIRLLAADFVTRRELVTTPGNRVTLTNTDLSVSGGGALTLSAAGAYTLTIPKTGTVPVGTGTAGRIAEWVTDANTVQASTLAKTGAGVLTLAAAGDCTLTVPATGTAALLGVANAFTSSGFFAGTLQVTGSAPAPTSGAGIEINYNSGTGLGRVQAYDRTLAQYLPFSFRGTEVLFFNSTVEVMRITSTANVLINTTTDNAQLSVNQSSATGAKPTLRLRQADLSEEFIRFDATVAAGNPINTTALGAYYGRVRVHVEGVGEKWLALYNT